MTWELQMGPRTWRIAETGLVIGRAPESDVVLNDPSVSRKHAVVALAADGTISVEDAQSRHGTRVNGVPITSATSLSHADRIAIAEHQFIVLDAEKLGRERPSTDRRVKSATAQTQPFPRAVRRPDATAEIDTTAMALTAAEDALMRNDGSSSARHLGPVRAHIAGAERAGGADAALVRRFAACALRTAAALGHGEWIDAVIDLHAIRPRVMHAATIDAFENALDRSAAHDGAKFARYVASVRADTRPLGPYEHFCVERLIKLAPT